MPSSRRSRQLLLASVLLAAVPVTFGLIRAVRTGDDVRYLWLAAAAILGSMTVMALGRGGSGPSRAWLGRALGAVAAGAACAAATAVLMGATAGPGVAIVTIAFGLCTGTSVALATLARQRRTP
ncbi:MAG: hypothetical protein JJE40_00185 [Vicinamibacteria bacterium]|nr:hypothetical protein [Vicinamibacteria bacterium]